MSIDWSNLVLGPCMDQFALQDTSLGGKNSVMLNPIRSQPGAPPYPIRCVWEVTPYTIVQENEAPLVTTVLKIGLRLSEFSVPPTQGDQPTIDGQTYTLDTYENDGQGGVRWVCKAKAASQETHGGFTT